MQKLLDLICPHQHLFPIFGRCHGTLSLKESDLPTQQSEGVYQTTALDQDQVNRDVVSDSAAVDGPYSRKLYVCAMADAYLTHQGGCITRTSRLIEELSQHFDYPIREHRHLHSLRLLKKIHQIDQPVVGLAGAAQYNYHHWWFDIVPKLHLIRTYGEFPADPLYYVETSKLFQREILSFLGISSASCLNSREYQIIQARHALAASPRTPSQDPDRWMVNWLRKTFLPSAKMPPEESRCIIVSRRDAKTRGIVNEAEVVECLRLLSPVVIELGKLTVAQQMGYFAGAKWIIAPHGAGLTNIVFASPDCQVIELFGSTRINDCYRLLSEKIGCSHTCLLGEDVTDPQTGQAHMRVNLMALKNAITA